MSAGWKYSPAGHWVEDDGLIVAYMPAARGEDFARSTGPLLAAAPDLLDAAKLAVEACNPIPLTAAQHIAFADLTNAIAKAEGRT